MDTIAGQWVGRVALRWKAGAGALSTKSGTLIIWAVWWPLPGPQNVPRTGRVGLSWQVLADHPETAPSPNVRVILFAQQGTQTGSGGVIQIFCWHPTLNYENGL